MSGIDKKKNLRAHFYSRHCAWFRIANAPIIFFSDIVFPSFNLLCSNFMHRIFVVGVVAIFLYFNLHAIWYKCTNIHSRTHASKGVVFIFVQICWIFLLVNRQTQTYISYCLEWQSKFLFSFFRIEIASVKVCVFDLSCWPHTYNIQLHLSIYLLCTSFLACSQTSQLVRICLQSIIFHTQHTHIIHMMTNTRVYR